MADAYEQPLCAMCDKPSAQLCGGCRAIKYCSKACQKLDWRVHKLICKTYLHFLASRPDLEHNSMIYFSVDEPQPRFIWMRIDDGHSHPGIEQLAKHNIKTDFPEGRIGAKHFTGNVVLNRPLGPQVIMYSPPSAAQTCPCCHDKYAYNDSLADVDHELANTLRGPILAWAMHAEAHMAKEAQPLDLGPMDFRHMVDELRFLYSEIIEVFHLASVAKDGIKAVKLNCKGDQQFLGKDNIEGTIISPEAVSEMSQLTTPIADRLGFPLIVFKLPPAPIWRDRDLEARKHNCYSGWLNPFLRDPHLGSLIIFRKDGKDLHPNMLQTLFMFTARRLPPHDDTELLVSADRLNDFTEGDVHGWAVTLMLMEIEQKEVDNGATDQPEEDRGAAAPEDQPMEDQIMED